MATYRLQALENHQKPGTFFVSIHDDAKNKIADAPMAKPPNDAISWFRESLTGRLQKGDVVRVETDWAQDDLEKALAMVTLRIT